MWSDTMGDDKKEERKSYTFLDRRGLNNENTEERQEVKKNTYQAKEGPAPKGAAPTIDFTTLIMSFASASMISMGIVPDPATGTNQKNLIIAQQNIDIITVLKEKTKGNLTQEEDQLIDQILYELRMHYIEALKDNR
jgi:Domain of unknown function (DUF1844)